MTTLQTRHERVVVGIDSSESSRSAVAWAAQEARIRRSVLVITHVEPLLPDGADPRRAAIDLDALLTLSAATASLLEPGVPVGTLLLRGEVSDELVALSRTASLLVLGVGPGRQRSHQGAHGPLEDRVVAQSHCPVVLWPVVERQGLPSSHG